jgi:hypothetical protein
VSQIGRGFEFNLGFGVDVVDRAGSYNQRAVAVNRRVMSVQKNGESQSDLTSPTGCFLSGEITQQKP